MTQRLGNQLFKYAAVRALQLKFYPDYKLIINTYHYKKESEQRKSQGWDYLIKDFRLRNSGCSDSMYEAYGGTFFRICLNAGRKILVKLLPAGTINAIDHKILQPTFNLLGMYNPLGCSEYVKPLRSRSRHIFVKSLFENAAYFDGIRDVLLDEFTPIHDPLPHNLELLDDIMTSESVCVSIRRGDFLSSKYASEFNVCNEEYFITAMKALRKEIPCCKFFVFSDDVDDVKRSMHFPFDVVYERGNDPVWEKLRLMYSCRHFIISNSTFSWWGQYLGRNPNKIVYIPVPWHWKGEKWQGLYLPYMRKIECHK
ncbi:MAG: alpha-1,2-fucosyltransferase [Synergistaceae bacterium]|nr:alpha-1,2-fucosyltransferase [Synergistaceae bacterium]